MSIVNHKCVNCNWEFYKVKPPKNGLCSWCQKCPTCHR